MCINAIGIPVVTFEYSWDQVIALAQSVYDCGQLCYSEEGGGGGGGGGGAVREGLNFHARRDTRHQWTNILSFNSLCGFCVSIL